MPSSSVDDCRVVGFKIYSDERGHLVPIQFPEDTLDMNVNRIFSIFGVPRGATRGGHASKIGQQILIALSGFVTVDVEDVYGGKESVVLDGPHYGLYVPPMVWRTLRDFSPEALILALCDRHYIATGHCQTKQEWKERCA